jgi:hypothetical protein
MVDAVERSTDPVSFSALLFNISIVMSVFTTFILMGLSGEVHFCTDSPLLWITNVLLAGRIWWLGRKAQQTLGRNATSMYYTVGAMMCVSIIILISQTDIN